MQVFVADGSERKGRIPKGGSVVTVISIIGQLFVIILYNLNTISLLLK